MLGFDASGRPLPWFVPQQSWTRRAEHGTPHTIFYCSLRLRQIGPCAGLLSPGEGSGFRSCGPVDKLKRLLVSSWVDFTAYATNLSLELFDGPTDVCLQDRKNLVAELAIIQVDRAHISKALILDEHKNFVIEKCVHHRAFESPDFPGRSVVSVQACRCPGWRPTRNAALAGH